VAYLHDGQLTDRADVEREGWLSGSFSSLILYWAMQEGAGDVDAFIIVGGISDGFLGVQSLYEDEPQLPERYLDAIAALGRADRIPDFYLGHSLAFFPAQLPPTLIVHTKQDEVIPYNQSLRLAEAMAAAGMTYELFIYEDTTHYLDQINITPDTAELYRRLIAFLGQYVRQR
ncbi:MAG: prolyl oligopeptidase family serine peptidase, partial [Anaerolineae bacterium]|nr:prolyl oligopeptidase family serine peptidase [Anaerolineae bacterium]